MPEDTIRVTIVGLGLMGGSLGAALREAGGWLVTGHDNRAECRAAARGNGWVDRCADELEDALDSAQLIVLATPVSAILSYLEALGTLAPDGAVVIDLGSTKRAIVASMERLPERLSAVGGHPMAGMKTSGVDGVDPDLYRGRRFVLVENARSGERAVRLARRLVSGIGALPVTMDADSHDEAVAMISHAPHFLAVSLLNAAAARGDDLGWQLAAGGFRSATSAATDNPAMWRDIALSNAEPIAEALREVADRIGTLADLLSARDEDALDELLRRMASVHAERFP